MVASVDRLQEAGEPELNQDRVSEQEQQSMFVQRLEVEAGMKDEAARRAIDLGDFVTARTLFEDVLGIWRRLDRAEEIIYGLFHVAWVITQGQNLLQEARPLLEEALVLAEQLGSQRYIAPAVANLSGLALDEGNYPAALCLAQRALPAFLAFPDPLGSCMLLETCAMAAANLGQARQALQLFAAAEAERMRRNGPHTLPVMLEKLERMLAPARQAMGLPVSQLAEAAGRALTLEQAVAEALTLTRGAT